MNKNLVYIIVIMLVFTPVLARQGNTFNLDFEDYKSYTVILNPSDQIVFMLNGIETHTILDEVKQRTVELDVFPFFEGNKNPTYVTLGYDNYAEIDIERDGNKDLEIRLEKIYKTGGRAKLTFSLIEKDDPVKITGDVTKDVNEDNDSNIDLSFIIIASVLVLWMILRIFISKRNSKK